MSIDKSTINNFREKQLIVIRQMLKKGTEPTEQNIITQWKNSFDEDISELDDPEVFTWMKDKLGDWDLDTCDIQLDRLRRKGKKFLSSIGKQRGFTAKITKQLKTKLAIYLIVTKGQKFYGTYSDICEKMYTIPRKKYK